LQKSSNPYISHFIDKHNYLYFVLRYLFYNRPTTCLKLNFINMWQISYKKKRKKLMCLSSSFYVITTFTIGYTSLGDKYILSFTYTYCYFICLTTLFVFFIIYMPDSNLWHPDSFPRYTTTPLGLYISTYSSACNVCPLIPEILLLYVNETVLFSLSTATFNVAPGHPSGNVNL